MIRRLSVPPIVRLVISERVEKRTWLYLSNFIRYAAKSPNCRAVQGLGIRTHPLRARGNSYATGAPSGRPAAHTPRQPAARAPASEDQALDRSAVTAASYRGPVIRIETLGGTVAAMNDSLKIAYIVSSSYSGSTLLSFILNAHPRIGTISEFDRMDEIVDDPDFLCSCGSKLRSCPFFRDLGNDLRRQGLAFAVDDMDMMLRVHPNWRMNQLLVEKPPLIQSSTLEDLRDRLVDLLPVVRRKKRAYYARNEAFMRAVLRLQNADTFLDANKDPYRMRFLAGRFDVYGIYLFKNGIAGAYSYIKNTAHSRSPLAMEAASHRWFREQITITRSLEYLRPERVIQVAYSDLCKDVRSTVRSICAVLEIESFSPEDYAGVPHHIIGNKMRLGNVGEISERRDWEEHLSKADIETYRAILRKYEPTLRKLNPHLLERLWR